MTKKICIITSSYASHKEGSRSAGVFVRDFSSLLEKEGYEVFVLTPELGLKNYDESMNVHFFPWFRGEYGLSSHNPKNPIHFLKLISVMISGLFSALKFIKKNKIDYCLAMWAVPSGVFALATKFFFNTPYSVWSLGSDIWKIQDYPLGRVILKKVLKNAHKLYADGIQLSKKVEQISKRKCEFLASSRILQKETNEINYSKFDPTKKNFMFLGRYHQNKGIDLLIEAVGLLDQKEKNGSLFHIFGGGPLQKEIIERVKKLNLTANVFVNGFLDGDKVYSTMLKSDFIIIPSRIESIPIVLSDAMQSKKPVILTNVGDMGDLAKQYKIGLLVEPTSASIANGISQAISANQKQLDSFKVGIEDLVSYLDLKKSVKKFLDELC